MSHLVKQSQLKEILGHSWTKTKERYDGAFVNAEIPTTAKQITFTKVDNTKQNVSLADYARLKDQNNFEQDVAADNVYEVSDIKFGELNGNANENRVSGHRAITTKSFVNGYVDHMLIHTKPTLEVGAQTTWEIWAIKKGENKEADRVLKQYANKTAAVEERLLNGATHKVVKIDIKESFEKEVYFIVRCPGVGVRANTVTDSKYINDIVNLSEAPGSTLDSRINWTYNADSNPAVIHLFGRASIGSLANKIMDVQDGQVKSVNNQTANAQGNISLNIEHIPNLQAELDKRVLKTDLTLEGGTAAHVDKVPKLDSNGKLHTSLIPELAITRVKTAANETAAQGLIGDGANQLQTGDVVVLENTKKAYMYKGNNTNNFANDFLELTMGNGTVKSVSGGTPNANGNIVVGVVEGGATGITMSFGNGGTPVTVATYMTAQEVTEIKNLFV